jgi:outer membrane protein OmpA-like peptidoglycan-associated protein
VRLLLDWGRDPLVLYNADGSRRSVALQNQLFLNVGGSVVLLDRFRLALNAPVALYQNGASSLFDGVQVSPQSAGGIGDLALAVDVRILGAYGEAFALAAGIDVAMPTGSRGNLLGNGSVSAVPRVWAAGDLGIFAYAAQVGFVVRSPGQIANIRFNDEVRFAASGGLRLLSRRLLVGPELYASADVGKSGGQARSTALEGDLGAHYQFGSGFSAGLGVGTGLARSPGVPKVRGLALIGWSPVPAREVRPSDRDGDGVPDLADACPDEAGPPSSDPKLNGCPVPADRDQDGVPDAQDLCPDVPKGEHPDPDRLGCPDKDTDGDGIFDHSDQCPTVPAGRHPDPQRLGCPEGDRDRDGIVDSADQCPEVAAGLHPDPERPGCPLPDRDGDGVPDKVDACPDKPGAPDPDPKKNGCPGLVQLKDAQIVILQQVLFATDKDVILKESYPVLRAVANILKMEPNIKHVSIEGHTDTQGKPAHNLDLSERRAKSVKKWLVGQGIAEERLESHGFGQTKPVSDNKSAKGRAANRRVEFHILDQESPAE